MAANTPPGPGVDASGQTVIDPTPNVLHILNAAVHRLDDLREAAVKRQDDLRECESKHVAETAALRSYFGKELRQAETDRIDAIRSVDVGAVAAAAAVQLTQQNTLAATVASSAEAMRTQMQGQASTVATTLDAKIAPLQSAIADLQRFQFESAGGKAQIVETRDASADMKPVLDAIANLTAAGAAATGAQAQMVESRARSGNLGLWVGLAVAAIVGFSSVVLAAGGVAVAVMLR